MRTCMEQVRDLLKSKIQCIWIDSYEEAEVIKDLKEILNGMVGLSLHLWSHTEGLKKLSLTALEQQEPADPKLAHPKNLFGAIREAQESTTKKEGIYILRDLHLLNDTHEVKRSFRDLKEYPMRNYNPIIVISPVLNIPIEHEKLFTVVNYDVPSKKEIEKLVSSMAKHIETAVKVKGRDLKVPELKEQSLLVKACMGLTYNEISDVFAKSLVKYKELSLQAVMEEKIQLVKKAGVLDYVIPKFSFDDIGGNNKFKEWILEVEDSYSEEAIEFGCQRPKGYLALGIPGTSKSIGAEAIANKWGIPLLKLNMSKIMSKMVGDSERKIEQAFRVAKACAPCVFLWDEVEKMLGGIKSSNSSDSGTTARVFGKCLEFLNDNNNVFVVMTSNDVAQLPPEFTRSGRLDAMWYFSLPTFEERKEIFRIHLNKTGKKISDMLIEFSAKSSENFTGAEIQETVKIAMRKAYQRFKEDKNNCLTEDDINLASKEIIPLYKSSQEKILALESWAHGRARSTNDMNENEIDQSMEDDLLNGILSLER